MLYVWPWHSSGTRAKSLSVESSDLAVNSRAALELAISYLAASRRFPFATVDVGPDYWGEREGCVVVTDWSTRIAATDATDVSATALAYDESANRKQGS